MILSALISEPRLSPIVGRKVKIAISHLSFFLMIHSIKRHILERF